MRVTGIAVDAWSNASVSTGTPVPPVLRPAARRPPNWSSSRAEEAARHLQLNAPVQAEKVPAHIDPVYRGYGSRVVVSAETGRSTRTSSSGFAPTLETSKDGSWPAICFCSPPGSRSGQLRVRPLSPSAFDGKTIVVGSYIGAEVHPSWAHDLRADLWAHVELETTEYDVAARELPAQGGTSHSRESSLPRLVSERRSASLPSWKRGPGANRGRPGARRRPSASSLARCRSDCRPTQSPQYDAEPPMRLVSKRGDHPFSGFRLNISLHRRC